MVNGGKPKDGGGVGDLIILASQWPGVLKAGDTPALRPQANATERRCVTGLNRAWLQVRSPIVLLVS